MTTSNSLNPIPPQEKACREAPKCCPFCGRQPSFTEWKDSKKVTENGTVCPEVWFAGCNCFFVKSFAHHGTRQEAVDAWNTRSHPSLDDPGVVEMVAILESLANPKSTDYVGILPAIKVDAALAALKQHLGEDV